MLQFLIWYHISISHNFESYLRFFTVYLISFENEVQAMYILCCLQSIPSFIFVQFLDTFIIVRPLSIKEYTLLEGKQTTVGEKKLQKEAYSSFRQLSTCWIDTCFAWINMIKYGTLRTRWVGFIVCVNTLCTF